MYSGQIEHLHFEPTSACNARCPFCPRTYQQSLRTNPLLSIGHWNSKDLEKTLQDPIFKDLKEVLINGNFGDIVMHPEPKEILEPFLKRDLEIKINTNGGALSKEFWKWLGSISSQITVTFAIDGLEDTHHLYRRNTNFQTVIRNAQTFISAGGKAIWIMTKFDHNKHQMKACKNLAKKYNFFDFRVRLNFGRNGIVSVKDKNFQHQYYINDNKSKQITDFSSDQYIKGLDSYFENWSPQELKYENKKKINCHVKNYSIFLSYDKRLWPCCWTAQNYTLENNGQLTPDLRQIYKDYEQKDKDFNNVLVHSPSKILKNLKRFSRLSQSWDTNQPCITCQNTCGG
jgi:MoaA/NifB/PqqE/SkfB family radical SAM enzyme